MHVDPIRISLISAGEGVQIKVKDTGKTLEDMPALFNFLRNKWVQYGATAALEVPIVIRPQQQVRWGVVVDAFNQAVRAGFREVGVAPSGGE